MDLLIKKTSLNVKAASKSAAKKTASVTKSTKIDVAKNSQDKPDWMGKVDFSGLKLKLIASIVAISSIGLLEAFISIGSKTKDEIYLMVLIHSVFILSGVVIAIMDYVASKTISHYTGTDLNH